MASPQGRWGRRTYVAGSLPSFVFFVFPGSRSLQRVLGAGVRACCGGSKKGGKNNYVRVMWRFMFCTCGLRVHTVRLAWVWRVVQCDALQCDAAWRCTLQVSLSMISSVSFYVVP